MKEDSTERTRRNRRQLMQLLAETNGLTVGLDLSDKKSSYCVLSAEGEVWAEDKVSTTVKAIRERFERVAQCRVAIEVGTHSPWVSRVLEECGHEVIVANPRNLPLLTQSSRKDDRMDAQNLARFARADVKLLSPIRHRGAQAQTDLMMVRARAVLVEARTKLLNSARGLTKSVGARLGSSSADAAGPHLAEDLKEPVRAVIGPLLRQVAVMTAQIKAYDRALDEIAQRYPETERLQQVAGVGPLVSLAFVLTIEDPSRFHKSRDVGCYLGLRPRKQQSGNRDPRLGISKEGDKYLRSLLINSTHYILGRYGPDSDLRRWGLALAAAGDKRRAVVAVARRLAILLHKLWVSGEEYEPLRNSLALSAAA